MDPFQSIGNRVLAMTRLVSPPTTTSMYGTFVFGRIRPHNRSLCRIHSNVATEKGDPLSMMASCPSKASTEGDACVYSRAMYAVNESRTARDVSRVSREFRTFSVWLRGAAARVRRCAGSGECVTRMGLRDREWLRVLRE